MDTAFLAGEFLRDCLPRERQYLYRYFRTEVQRAFVRYVHVFGATRFFAAHTGMVCARRTRQVLMSRLRAIEAAHRDAKDRLDLDALESIEKGRLRVGEGQSGDLDRA